MPFRTRIFGLLLIVAALLIPACSDPSAPPAALEPTFIRLVSDPGDFIGLGRTYNYRLSDAVIAVHASGSLLTITIDGDERWYGEFQFPGAGTRLQPGTYEGMTRYPLHATSTGGMSWSGGGRGCNTLTGSVTIDSVTYVAGALATLDMRFTQHCDEGAAALNGAIHWRADEEITAPAPIRPIPADLWQPPSGTTPGSGEFVYLQSDAGDWIGQGMTYLYTEPGTGISVSTVTNGVEVSVGGWMGDFHPMSTLSRLETGYYPDVGRFPFHNTRKGGMSWYGNGRACNAVSGWFAVDAVTYSGTTITALDLRFEQHCEGGTTALRGKIRWRA